MAQHHLVVLIHGLQGNTGHMKFMEDRFKKLNQEEEYREENYIVFNMKANDDKDTWSNNWSKTGDGIQNGGDRLISELKERIEGKVDEFDEKVEHKISFVGSSLGGLYCRYVMGSLFDNEKQKIVVQLKEKCLIFQLENYVAMASPLISVRCLVSTFFHYGMKAFFYKGTGNEMLLDDSNQSEEAMICKLASPKLNYYQALKSCKRRIALCSCKKDETKVAYQSSAIAPYRDISDNQTDKSKPLPHLKSKLVKSVCYDEEGAFIEDLKNVDKSRFYFNGDSKATWIAKMISNLRQMSWMRADVDLYHAQAAIVNENRSEIADLVLKLWTL